jgi:hypothetical protein
VDEAGTLAEARSRDCAGKGRGGKVQAGRARKVRCGAAVQVVLGSVTPVPAANFWWCTSCTSDDGRRKGACGGVGRWLRARGLSAGGAMVRVAASGHQGGLVVHLGGRVDGVFWRHTQGRIGLGALGFRQGTLSDAAYGSIGVSRTALGGPASKFTMRTADGEGLGGQTPVDVVAATTTTHAADAGKRMSTRGVDRTSDARSCETARALKSPGRAKI